MFGKKKINRSMVKKKIIYCISTEFENICPNFDLLYGISVTIFQVYVTGEAFFLMCTLVMWRFSLFLCENDFLQMSHEYCWILLCTLVICLFKLLLSENDFAHISHKCCLWLSCTLVKCCLRLCLREKDLSQISQACCFILLCTILICLFRLLLP